MKHIIHKESPINEYSIALLIKDAALNKARRERGTLIASGFIAGGALMGVLSALLRYLGYNWVNMEWFESHAAEMLGLVMFMLISLYMIWDTLKAKKES